jgi:hypothetical protein
MYKEVWASNTVQMPSPLNERSFKEYLRSLHFPNIVSGNAWYIPLSKGKGSAGAKHPSASANRRFSEYMYDGEFKKGNVGGGTITSSYGFSTRPYTFRLYS